MKSKVHRQTKAPLRINVMRGVALVETLVAILIFSVGVLGLVGMQAAMTRAQGAGKFRADAANLANEVIGLMWVDRPQSIGVLSSNLTKYTTANCDTYDPCSDWKAKVGSLLPLGTTAITADETSGAVTITLTWTIANEGLHSYATSTNVFIK